MKKLLLITALLITASSFGQCLSIINGRKSSPSNHSRESYQHFYAGFNFDVNNAFQIDETRTEPRGLDYDIEIGYRDYDLAYYAFYGDYNKVEYTNYGAGVDYFVFERGNLDVLLGVNVGGIDITSPISGRRVTYFAYAGRVKTIYNINNSIGIFAVGQYQQRYDRADVEGIVEGMIGIQFYIN